jgi:hypothetical protein
MKVIIVLLILVLLLQEAQIIWLHDDLADVMSTVHVTVQTVHQVVDTLDALIKATK